MFDYISALYYGESLGICRPSPLDEPVEIGEKELVRHLERVTAAMGGEFSEQLLRSLRVVLEGCRLEGFHSGVHIGGQLTLSILGDLQ